MFYEVDKINVRALVDLSLTFEHLEETGNKKGKQQRLRWNMHFKSQKRMFQIAKE